MAVLIAAAELQQDGKLVGRSNIMKHLQGHEDQEVKSVSEYRVRKCLDKLQKEYRSAYEMQQGIYEARLQERDEEIASLKEKLSKGPAHE